MLKQYNITQNRTEKRWFRDQHVFFLSVLILFCYTLFLRAIPFFGDHVTLISSIAVHYHETGFQSLFLPEHLGTGHPPFYPLLIAFLWTLFGKSLLISHLVTFVFSVFLLWQFYLLTKHFTDETGRKLLLLLFLFHPVLLAQISAMSIDILLTALFFAGINNILKKNNYYLLAIMIVCVLISLRGCLLLAAFFMIDISLYKYKFNDFVKRFLLYLLAIIPCSIYFYFQYQHAGWWLIPDSGNWSAGRAWSTGIYIPAKFMEFGIRFFEFGMIIPLLFILFFMVKQKKGLFKLHIHRIVFFTSISLLLFIIPFRNPVLIRYLLPLHLSLLIYFIYILTNFYSKGIKIRLTILTLLLFMAQHFFVYPQMRRSIFEYSWGEGSLAHLPVFELREKGKNYIIEHQIDPLQVHTAFPEYKAFEYSNLSDENFHYSTLDTLTLFECPFVLYSNTMNSISKSTENKLKNEWIPVFSFYKYPIEYILFKNPNL